MSDSSRIDALRKGHPKAFEVLSYLAFLDGNNISIELLKALLANDSEEVLDEAIDYLSNEGLIIKDTDLIVELSVQKETADLVEKDVRTFILNNIVYVLNNLLTEDDIQDLRFTHELRILNLFKHVVRIHQNFWINTYKSDYSAEVLKKLGTLNEEYLLKYEDALNNYHDVLVIYESILPANDISIPDIYNNIGAVYAKLGANDKALNSYNQALMLYEGIKKDQVLFIEYYIIVFYRIVTRK